VKATYITGNQYEWGTLTNSANKEKMMKTMGETTNEEKRATDRIVSESAPSHWSSAIALLHAFIGSNN
jgi:hypothetical protein